MKRCSQDLTKKKPINQKPTAPIVIWSNSAYDEADEQSSTGSNEPWPADDTTTKKFLMCEEERKLREELGREIEKELERELMDGIVILVRRLSDLKAKQYLRELGDPRRVWGISDDGLMMKKKWGNGGGIKTKKFM